MENLSIPTKFSLNFVGELEKVNDMISKIRALIYYKGGNRNGSWITDEFAEVLNSSLPFVPIVGSYNEETEDFEGHADNGKKKAYGVVPSDNNIAWETSTKDGRDYLATDVYLWTGYWEEAEKIVDKQLSMELNRDTISGEWKVIDGEYFFVYTAGTFKGICALGDELVPCFEGASFYSLDEKGHYFFDILDKKQENITGGKKMEENDTIQEDFSKVEETTETTAEEFEDVTVVRTLEETVKTSVESTTGYKEENETTLVSVTTEVYPDYEAQIADLKEKLAEKEKNFELAQIKIAEYKLIIDDLKIIQSEYEMIQKMEVIKKFEGKLPKEKIAEFVESLPNTSTEELTTKLSLSLAQQVLSDNEFTTKAKEDFVPTAIIPPIDGVASIIKKHTGKK